MGGGMDGATARHVLYKLHCNIIETGEIPDEFSDAFVVFPPQGALDAAPTRSPECPSAFPWAIATASLSAAFWHSPLTK
eukprot:6170649-Pyramimonas_sp.AAC.1